MSPELESAVTASGLDLQAYLDTHLNNPGDPYFLASKDEKALRYLAPMACGQVERYELCRRARMPAKSPSK